MSKKWISEQIDLKYKSPKDIAKTITEAIEKYGENNVNFDVDTDEEYGSVYGTCYLTCRRVETDEECYKREVREKAQQVK